MITCEQFEDKLFAMLTKQVVFDSGVGGDDYFNYTFSLDESFNKVFNIVYDEGEIFIYFDDDELNKQTNYYIINDNIDNIYMELLQRIIKYYT